jgi:hypothetical protein
LSLEAVQEIDADVCVIALAARALGALGAAVSAGGAQGDVVKLEALPAA